MHTAPPGSRRLTAEPLSLVSVFRAGTARREGSLLWYAKERLVRRSGCVCSAKNSVILAHSASVERCDVSYRSSNTFRYGGLEIGY